MEISGRRFVSVNLTLFSTTILFYAFSYVLSQMFAPGTGKVSSVVAASFIAILPSVLLALYSMNMEEEDSEWVAILQLNVMFIVASVLFNCILCYMHISRINLLMTLGVIVFMMVSAIVFFIYMDREKVLEFGASFFSFLFAFVSFQFLGMLFIG